MVHLAILQQGGNAIDIPGIALWLAFSLQALLSVICLGGSWIMVSVFRSRSISGWTYMRDCFL